MALEDKQQGLTHRRTKLTKGLILQLWEGMQEIWEIRNGKYMGVLKRRERGDNKKHTARKLESCIKIVRK